MSNIINDKIAVIIGVGPGLGSSLCKRFSKGGYSIAMIARRIETIKPLELEINNTGRKSLAIQADAGSIESIKSAFTSIRELLGNPEVLIYNATIFKTGSILDLKPTELQSLLNISTIGALTAVQEIIPYQLKLGRGTILFTGATAALRGSLGFGGLSIAKFANRALSQTMARELHPKGIHVAHIIVDGQINTPTQVSNQPNLSINSFLNSDSIAETYWQIHIQDSTCWTQEMDIRPSVEKF